MSWRGGFSCDENVRKGMLTVAPHWQHTGSAPGAVSGGPQSGRGYEYTNGEGGESTNSWLAFDAGNCWYMFMLTVSTFPTGDDIPSNNDYWQSVSFHYQATTNVTGGVRMDVRYHIDTAPEPDEIGFHLDLEYYTGAAWTRIQGTTLFTEGTDYCVIVRINTTATTGRTINMWVNGTSEISSATSVDLIANTPSVFNNAEKGTKTYTFRFWEIFGLDTDNSPGPNSITETTDYDDPTDNSQWHCYGAIPKGDVVEDGNWTQSSDWRTGYATTGLSPGRFRYGHVDSIFDDNAGVGEFISQIDDGTDNDWMFHFNEYSGSEDVDGVGFVLMGRLGAPYTDAVAVDVVARTSAVAPTALSLSIVSGFQGTYVFTKGTPVDQTATWTKTLFNALEAGPRVPSTAPGAATWYVFDFMLEVIGKNLSVPSQQVRLPPPSSPAISNPQIY